jgi:hypothetical protein
MKFSTYFVEALKYSLVASMLAVLHFVRRWALNRFGSIAVSELKETGEDMFEKENEIEEKIGDFGVAKVDIEPDFDIKASLEGALKKDVLSQLPGALGVEISLGVKLHADPVGIALHFLGQSQNATVKFIAEQLAKVKAGEEVHPAIASAMVEVK